MSAIDAGMARAVFDQMRSHVAKVDALLEQLDATKAPALERAAMLAALRALRDEHLALRGALEDLDDEDGG